MPHSAATGEHIAGILGIDFLSQYSIGFSATDRVIRLYAPGSGRFSLSRFKRPQDGS